MECTQIRYMYYMYNLECIQYMGFAKIDVKLFFFGTDFVKIDVKQVFVQIDMLRHFGKMI